MEKFQQGHFIMLPGERLKTVRKSLHLSQTQFGQDLGMKKERVVDLERGKAKLTAEVALKVQEVYAINYNWLMDEEGEMRPSLEDNEVFQSIPESPYKDLIRWLEKNPDKIGEVRAFTQGLEKGSKKKRGN